MGEMRDSDWLRRNLLRSDWLLPTVAIHTTGNRNSEGRDGVQREAVSDQGIISGGSEEHC